MAGLKKMKNQSAHLRSYHSKTYQDFFCCWITELHMVLEI